MCLQDLVKSAYQKINFLISKPKRMLWVLKRTVSMNRSFEHPKHMLKLMGKENIIIQFDTQKVCLSKPMYLGMQELWLLVSLVTLCALKFFAIKWTENMILFMSPKGFTGFYQGFKTGFWETWTQDCTSLLNFHRRQC